MSSSCGSSQLAPWRSEATVSRCAQRNNGDFGDVVLLDGCHVHGRVVDTKGLPRPDTGVHLLRKDPRSPQEVRGLPRTMAYAETDAQAWGRSRRLHAFGV